MTTTNSGMLQRGDTAANWTAANPVLRKYELGVEGDTGKAKIGDGTTAWTALPYFALDADLLPGGRVGPTCVDISYGDLTTLTANGWYQGTNLKNSPDGSVNGFFVEVMTLQADYDRVTQIAYGYAGGVWVRTSNYYSWGAWRRMVEGIAAGPDTGWIAPGTQAFGNVGGPWSALGYRRNALGYVYLQGNVYTPDTATPTTVFTLPAGYRPASNLRVVAASGAPCLAEIDSSGAVIATSYTVGAFISFDGIHFLAEQ